MKIALGGIAGSGKDFLAESLAHYYRVAFANEVKKECSRIFNWMNVDYPPLEKEQPLNINLSNGKIITATPREVWLDVAAVMRKYENDIFIRKLHEHLEMVSMDNIIITDVRTKAELEFCKNNGFITIYIEPEKILYEPNEYDAQLLVIKKDFDYSFVNDFNFHSTKLDFSNFIKKLKGFLNAR